MTRASLTRSIVQGKTTPTLFIGLLVSGRLAVVAVKFTQRLLACVTIDNFPGAFVHPLDLSGLLTRSPRAKTACSLFLTLESISRALPWTRV